jgi:hypothetical protein
MSLLLPLTPSSSDVTRHTQTAHCRLPSLQLAPLTSLHSRSTEVSHLLLLAQSTLVPSKHPEPCSHRFFSPEGKLHRRAYSPTPFIVSTRDAPSRGLRNASVCCRSRTCCHASNDRVPVALSRSPIPLPKTLHATLRSLVPSFALPARCTESTALSAVRIALAQRALHTHWGATS